MTAPTQPNRQELIEKARKLLRLAKRGEGGEQTNARRFYEEFLAKNNLQKSEVEDSNERKFRIKFQDEYSLCATIILSIDPFTKIHYENGAIRVELDKEDYIEAKARFKYYKMLWRSDKQMLELAFYTLHTAAFQPDDHTKKKHDGRKGINHYEEAKKQAESLTQKAEALKESLEAFKAHGNSDEEKLRIYNLGRMQKILPHLSKSNYKPTR